MKALSAARTGLFLGFACTFPVAVWLLPRLLRAPAGTVEVRVLMLGALRALWITQGIAIAVAGPEAAGLRCTDHAARSLILIAVPFPLLSIAWLAGAAEAIVLVRAVSLLLAVAGCTLAQGLLFRLDVWNGEMRRLASATVEIGLASCVWALQDEWLGWVGI